MIKASQPVQVITGIPCIYLPECANGQQCGACDHMEESVFPAETLGKDYVVTKPSGPEGTPVAYWAKLYGNIDGTQLSYPSGGQPGTAPTTINAGQVVDLGQITNDFEVKGDHEFAVATFLLGAAAINPTDPDHKGDPSESLPTAVEQYRTKYIFLAPTDYSVNYVDLVGPPSAQVTVDGAPVPGTLFTPIGTSSFGIAHLNLINSNVAGAH